MTNRTNLAAVAVAALVGALLAGVWGAMQPERYEATTVVALAPSDAIVQDADLIDVVGGLDRGTLVETFAGLAASTSVTSTAAAEVGIDEIDSGDYDVDAVRAVGSNLVDITVTGPDAELVAELSTVSAQIAAGQFNTLYRVYRVDPVTAATAPTESSRPSLLLLVVGGAAVAGIAAAIVVVALDSRRRDQHLHAIGSADDRRPMAS